MKTWIIINSICILLLASCLNFPQQEDIKLRVGTFDSRCIALAYGRSDEFMKLRDSIETVYSKAKADTNKQIIEEIEQFKKTMQVLLHQQVFSNSSIINLLAKLKEKFPTIADDNDVQMIMSKWEIMFTDESIELVDITDQLVDCFNPNEETRKILENVKSTDPVLIEEISVDSMK